MSMDVGSQESGQQEYTEPAAAPEAPQAEDHSTQEPEPEANPFWSEVEKLTGPNVYKLIQPHLSKADTEARNRISALNQSYAPWKALADRGVQPQHVDQALGVVQQLNDPDGQVQVYESLRTFLKENGRLPDAQELQQQVADDQDPNGEGEDPRDAQLQALQEQQAQIAQFLQNQHYQAEQQAAAQEADTWLNGEVQRLSSDPKNGFDENDIKEIVRIAAFQAQQTGQDPESLDSAAQQYIALRDRIRTTPRPSQLAPRLPSGPGGGTPSAQQVDPSTLTKQQRQELVAQMLQQRQG